MACEQYERYDGLGLAQLVRRGETSALELVDAAIARIEAGNPKLNAVVRPMFESARETARRALPDGPLSGVPILLKDLISTVSGVPTGCGNRLLRGVAAPADSEYVRRLRAAGVVFVGKTNTPEFGLLPVTEPESFGATRNPWDPAHSPGGSSGGSAAAVAARWVPIATAGDGGGSIRIPASCCALFGLKLSRGRTPTGPMFGEIWRGFASEHVLTVSVRDSAAMLDATAGVDPGAPYAAPERARPFLDEVTTEPGRLRIAFTARPLFGQASAPVHPDCLEALDRAVALLAQLGHDVVEEAPPVDAEACALAFVTILAAETRAQIEWAARIAGVSVRSADFELATWCLGLLGRATPASEYAAAASLLQQAGRTAAGFFGRHDLLLTPTLAQPPVLTAGLAPSAPERAAMRVVAALGAGWLMRAMGTARQLALQTFAYMPFTPLFNATGQPAMSVPLHWSAAGLPIGVQFAARLGEEATLLRVAGQLERAAPWRDRLPPLASKSG